MIRKERNRVIRQYKELKEKQQIALACIVSPFAIACFVGFVVELILFFVASYYHAKGDLVYMTIDMFADRFPAKCYMVAKVLAILPTIKLYGYCKERKALRRVLRTMGKKARR